MSEIIKEKYKDTKLGLIPSHWEIRALGKIGKTINGLTYSPKDIDKDGVLVLRSSNVQNRQILLEDNVFVNVDKDNYNPVKENDLLICVRNGSRSLIGKNALIKKEQEGLAFGAFMSIFRSLDNNYLYQLFDTDIYNREIHRNLGATINSINGGNLKKFRFPFPPKEERDKITKILSKWDEAIETMQNLIEQLQVRKKGLMQELLSGKKRLTGFAEEWTEDKLGSYFTERKETGLGNLPLLSVGKEGVYPQDVSNKKDTSNSNKSKYKKICKGDIGYNTMRMWQGRSALSDLEGIVSPAYTILKPKENCDSVFFSYLFKLDDMIHKFYRNSQGMVSDTWMCKFKDFKIVKFNAPSSIEEQKAISKIIGLADVEIEEKKAYLLKLKEQKKGLMQQLLTGKKRVTI
jgi:type I restriction enzyme S subunit